MSVHIESAGRGRPLVLLHGLGMHSGVWMPLLPRLVERYRVHSVDLPGHGHSPPVAPYSIALLAREVAAAVAALPDVVGAPPVVLGWSVGGLVAMEWARTRPDSMLGLVLSSSTACFVQRPDWPHAMAATTLAQFGDEFAASYRRTLLRFLTLQARGSEQGRAALAQLHDHLLDRGEPAPATLRAAFGLLAITDMRDAVHAIALPSLVLGGDRDTLVPSAALRWLANALPNATLDIVADAAHTPFLSHPDAFVAALDRFCDDN